MLTVAQKKYIRSLHLKKFRQQHGFFIAEGPHLVEQALHAQNVDIELITGTNEWINQNGHLCSTHNLTPIVVNEKELIQVSAQTQPNQVLAVIRNISWNLTCIKSEGLTLLLDDIVDPGNLGTIIRLADWFGVSEVVCSNNSVELFNPKTVQATMGSVFRVPVTYCNLVDYINTILVDDSQIPVVGAMMNGENLFATDLPRNCMVILGNESRGISEELAELITHRTTIPFFGSAAKAAQTAESLNVAMAATVYCSHYRNGKP